MRENWKGGVTGAEELVRSAASTSAADGKMHRSRSMSHARCCVIDFTMRECAAFRSGRIVSPHDRRKKRRLCWTRSREGYAMSISRRFPEDPPTTRWSALPSGSEPRSRGPVSAAATIISARLTLAHSCRDQRRADPYDA